MTHLGNVLRIHTELLGVQSSPLSLSVAVYFIEGYALGMRAPL